MVGILVVTHGRLAQEFVATAELIVDKMDSCVGLSLDPDLPVDELRQQIDKAMGEVDDGDVGEGDGDREEAGEPAEDPVAWGFPAGGAGHGPAGE